MKNTFKVAWEFIILNVPRKWFGLADCDKKKIYKDFSLIQLDKSHSIKLSGPVKTKLEMCMCSLRERRHDQRDQVLQVCNRRNYDDTHYARRDVHVVFEPPTPAYWLYRRNEGVSRETAKQILYQSSLQTGSDQLFVYRWIDRDVDSVTKSWSETFWRDDL